jgi:integrase
VALRQGSAADRRPAAVKARDRYLTKEERDQLLESIETPHVRLFVILALTTGARMGAILDLTWDRVDLKRERSTSTRRPRQVEQAAHRRSDQLAAAGNARRGAESSLSDHVIEYGGSPWRA